MSMLILLSAFVLLICAHEAAHAAVARWCGMKLLECGLGIGPRLFSFNRRGVSWTCRLLFVAGAYVRFASRAELTEGEAYRGAEDLTPLQAANAYLAGPLANILMAWVLMTILMALPIPVLSPTIGSVTPGSPAAAIGFKDNDTIVAVNGQPTKSWNNMTRQAWLQRGKPLQFTLADGRSLTGTLFEHNARLADGATRNRIAGFSPSGTTVLRYGGWQAPLQAAQEIRQIVASLGPFMAAVISDKEQLKNTGGPISGLRDTSKALDSKEKGLETMLLVFALFSLVLGLVNLLPIPLFDGGQALGHLIEWGYGTPLPAGFMRVWNMVGLGAIWGLTMLAVGADIVKLFS